MMKINSIKPYASRKNNMNFSGFINNKFILSGLEKISDHSASFILGTSLAGAAFLRPLAISFTPKVDKENKKYASANSLSSAAAKFVIAEAVALPVENAIKKIDKNPENFLNKDTVANFYTDKKNYNFLTQLIKQAANILTAIPKSYLTVALIPVIMDKIPDKKTPEKEKINPLMFKSSKPFFSAFDNISFGKKPENMISESMAKGIGKIIENENLQNFSKKHSKNSTNITRNTSILTDILLTSASVFQTKNSKKIKKERKNPLIYNNILSTSMSILFGFGIDSIVQKGTKNAIKNFKNMNKSNPKLDKYIDGINVLRPAIIFALVYYGFLPVVTTYLADKADKAIENKKAAEK